MIWIGIGIYVLVTGLICFYLDSRPTRAQKTLIEHLDPRQRIEYEAYDRFKATGKSGTVYTISRHQVSQARGWYCTYCPGVPKEDAMLAFKLAIELDEYYFLSHANLRS